METADLVPDYYRQKFETGLANCGFTYDDLFNNFTYCGGNSGKHLNYFRSLYGDAALPAYSNVCLCGHTGLVKNCYMTNGQIFLILGHDCIKPFQKKLVKTCDKCGNPHQNRITNKCNICRYICEICGDSHNNPIGRTRSVSRQAGLPVINRCRVCSITPKKKCVKCEQFRIIQYGDMCEDCRFAELCGMCCNIL
jgi:hypothetical protein